MKNTMFSGYIARNHVGSNLTDRELKVLKNGDIDSMVSTFVKLKHEEYVLQLKCALNILKRFLGDEMTLERITVKEEYQGEFIGSQIMDGDMDVFFGIIGTNESLLKLASIYAREDFEEFDADAYDAVCELINCTNGAFATRLCDEDVDVVLYPPVFYDNVHVTSNHGFYVVTIGYEGNEFDMIMAINENVTLANQDTYL
jgi:CheY-specific phosphatase CheX